MKRMGWMVILVFMFCTACSDRAHELEESAIVNALAVDCTDAGYSLVASVAGAEEAELIRVEGESVAQCFLRLNAQSARRVFLGQLRLIALSAELQDIEEVLLYLYAAEDVRSAARVVTVAGSVQELLQEPAIEQLTDHEQANFMPISLYGCVNSMAAEAGYCILPLARDGNLTEGVLYRHYHLLQVLSEDALAGCAMLAEKDAVYLTAAGGVYSLTHIAVEDGKLSCRYHALSEVADGRFALERRIAECLRAAQEVFGIAAEYAITAIPAGNDYALRGGAQ